MKTEICTLGPLALLITLFGCDRSSGPATQSYQMASQRYDATDPQSTLTDSASASPSASPSAEPHRLEAAPKLSSDAQARDRQALSHTPADSRTAPVDTLNSPAHNQASLTDENDQTSSGNFSQPPEQVPEQVPAGTSLDGTNLGAPSGPSDSSLPASDRRVDALVRENERLKRALQELRSQPAPPAPNRDALSNDDSSQAEPPTQAESAADAQLDSAVVLNPRRRLHREVRGTTASVEGGRFFGDDLMPRVMRDPRRLPAGRMFPAEFDARLHSAQLKVGDLFSVSVIQDDAPQFGPIMEGGGLNIQGSYFECIVEEADELQCKFKVQYFVMPHPNGKPDHELAIPINAVVLPQPTDERPDLQSQAHEAGQLAGAFGQVGGGIEPNFLAEAAMKLSTKYLKPMIGQDESTVCILQNEIKQHTPCYVRINDNAVF
ncbi:MAG: hypothetical protein IT423_04600 [Pirellulaceae bacterium]|nr:hypothetical protein [Pirellulaceae bacterium]